MVSGWNSLSCHLVNNNNNDNNNNGNNNNTNDNNENISSLKVTSYIKCIQDQNSYNI